MFVVSTKVNEILKRKNLTHYKLSKLMDFPEGALGMMIGAKSPFSQKATKKILPILEVSKEEFESWVIADKYPKEILELVVKNKKNFNYKRKSMLTANIDKLLKEKGISRTTLSKQINYDQSSLNRIITKKVSMSKSVLERISDFFEISQDEIFSWIVADKYSLEVLERALLCKLENPESS